MVWSVNGYRDSVGIGARLGGFILMGGGGDVGGCRLGILLSAPVGLVYYLVAGLRVSEKSSETACSSEK